MSSVGAWSQAPAPEEEVELWMAWARGSSVEVQLVFGVDVSEGGDESFLLVV